jgi:A/G-specific adenine glycosylase
VKKIFSERLLAWFDQHGRKDLPWQSPRNAYRVWVSEIMLQQTQVSTVIPYFERFMQRFGTLQALALASSDEVMHYWAGLGYYARARNMHKAAMMLHEQGLSDLPDSREALEQLPGIGRSTAAAIVAQVWNQPEAILDGNVKRVLTRHAQIEGWTGQADVLKQLWQLAEEYTPKQRVADYTQAIMDLGATLCTRSKPKCTVCPLTDDCKGLAANKVSELPTPKKKKQLPVKQRRFLVLQNAQQQVLLQKRPPAGIWGGLWSLPELTEEQDVTEFCHAEFGLAVSSIQMLDVIKHSFSHYHLYMTPLLIQCQPVHDKIAEPHEIIWYHKDQSDALGLPAPINVIMQQLNFSK